MALEKGSRPKPQRKPVPKSSTPARTAARPARETADTSGEQPRRAEAPRSAAPQSLFAARRDEFIGIAYVAAGVLVGLGIYFNLAGPFGRGVEQVVGWLTGLGRYLVPIILVTTRSAPDVASPEPKGNPKAVAAAKVATPAVIATVFEACPPVSPLHPARVCATDLFGEAGS
mgnify:CR=1 FL=1